MDIIVHLGAHRTGTATFKTFMRQNKPQLAEAGIGYWGPDDTRQGLFSGLFPKGPALYGLKNQKKRAEGRVKLRMEETRQSGAHTLVVSEENMLGSLRNCVRNQELYPEVGERMSRYARAFDGKITRIVMSIRSQDRFWASALSSLIAQGYRVSTPKHIDAIAKAKRTWRDVITDLGAAVPGVEICVLPFESFYANPYRLVGDAMGLEAAFVGDPEWLNRTPTLTRLRRMLEEREQDASQLPDEDGRWEPFDQTQTLFMQESYQDDMFWLAQGAGGVAKLTEEAIPHDRGIARRAGEQRGQQDEFQFRVEQNRRS